MKRAGRLMERVVDCDNLREAYVRAARGKRAKRDARAFADRLDDNLLELAGELSEGTYTVGPYHRFTIHDPKERLITAPCFRDRVVHHALMRVCDPVFERFLIFDTYACRVGKGREAAVARASEFARRHPWFLKMDICRYFDSIPHATLLALLARKFKDRRLLGIFDRIVASAESSPGRGIPIGSLTSQHFANFYLGWLDRYVKETLRIQGYVRYMDDFVVWGDDRGELRSARDRIATFLERELSLSLKLEPYINRVVRGMDFLGCRVGPGVVRLNRRSRVRFGVRLRALDRLYAEGGIGSGSAQQRATALVAFTSAAGARSWRWRRRVVQSLRVDGQDLEPGESGRELEQHRQELPPGEPQ